MNQHHIPSPHLKVPEQLSAMTHAPAFEVMHHETPSAFPASSVRAEAVNARKGAHPHRLDENDVAATERRAMLGYMMRKLGEKHVTFDTVSERLYVSTLGDNPSVTSGVPVGLGDEWVDASEVTIEQHVELKYWRQKVAGARRRRSRHPYCRRLTREERLARCIESGCRMVDIKNRILEVQQAKEQRMHSLPQSLMGIDWEVCMHDMQNLCFAAFQNFIGVGAHSQDTQALDSGAMQRRNGSLEETQLCPSSTMGWMPTVSMSEALNMWLAPLAEGLQSPQTVTERPQSV